ncbi:MAG: hypothetical protein V1872_08890 [bacterium]
MIKKVFLFVLFFICLVFSAQAEEQTKNHQAEESLKAGKYAKFFFGPEQEK